MGKAEKSVDRSLASRGKPRHTAAEISTPGVRESRRRGSFTIRVATGIVLMALGATLLTGCMAGNTTSPSPASSSPATSQAQEDPRVAELAAKSSQIQAAVRAILPQDGFPARDVVQKAITDTGVPLEQVAVGQAVTPTNLAVDAMQFAVNDADVCLMGEIRGGQVSMTQLPALSGGKCFVGDETGKQG